MKKIFKKLTKQFSTTKISMFSRIKYKTLEWELIDKYNKHFDVVQILMYEKEFEGEVSRMYLGSIFITLKLIPEIREHKHNKILFLDFNHDQRCIYTDEDKQVTTSLGSIVINQNTNVDDFINRYKEPLWDMKNDLYYVPYVNCAFIKVLLLPPNSPLPFRFKGFSYY